MNGQLTIKEASGVLGVSEKTIRRKIKGGHLLSSVQDGKHLINKENLEVFQKVSMQAGQVDSGVQAQLTVELRALQGLIRGLTAENQRLQYEVNAAKEESRQLSAIVYDLSGKLTRLLPAPKETKSVSRDIFSRFYLLLFKIPVF